MLTVYRSYTFKSALRYSLIGVCFATISACADRTSESPTITDKVSSAELQEPAQAPFPKPPESAASSQANDKVASALLEDGFYQQQTPANETKLNESPERREQTKDAQATDTKALLEDLGFSGAQLNSEPSAGLKSADPYCLSTEGEMNIELEEKSVEMACQRISKRLASVKYATCAAAKLQPTGCSSVQGFPILMREFPPINEIEPQGRILIIGGTHGDELTSVSVTLRWIEKLNRHHSGLFHWHLVPMMNPDGVLKNGATRTNHNGVDLNRNMPSDDWERNAIKYWSEKGGKNPRKYPGQTASSEPETQWLIDEINSFKPDAIISVHAPYGVVDFDSLLLNTAPKSLGKLRLNLLGTYPGSLGNYAGINLNIPVITLELPHSWVMPSDNESTRIWEDIVTWLKKNVNTEVVKN